MVRRRENMETDTLIFDAMGRAPQQNEQTLKQAADNVQAYLVVAPYIAGHREYGPAMRGHLLDVKLRHWEASLRELASLALAALVPSDPLFFASTALDVLLPLCTDTSLEVRLSSHVVIACLPSALFPLNIENMEFHVAEGLKTRVGRPRLTGMQMPPPPDPPTPPPVPPRTGLAVTHIISELLAGGVEDFGGFRVTPLACAL